MPLPIDTPLVIEPLGDRGLLARFDTLEMAAHWAETLRETKLPGIVDVVTAYQSVGIHADPDRIDLDELAHRLAWLKARTIDQAMERLIELPVLYDGNDLPEVAERLNLSEDEVIRTHTGADYRVHAIGFQPGFPYGGVLPAKLSGLARRESPRTRVPPGSVAIVARQTAVYPSASAGGWHLLGRTPLRIVDVESGRFPIRAGDRLRFVAIGREEFEARRGDLL